MASLTVETLNKDRIKNAAGPVVFEQGQAYLNWGRVQVESVTEQAAHCYVHDHRLHPVTITVNQNYLFLKCDCEFAVRGKVCKHEVAAALAVHEHLRKKLPPRWTEQLGKVLLTAQESGKRSRPRPYLLFFSLSQDTHTYMGGWKIHPYQLPLYALPKELQDQAESGNLEAVYRWVEENPSISSQVKNLHSSPNPAGCLNCSEESAVLASIMVDRSRAYTYYYAAFPFEDYLALIASTRSPLFLGQNGSPLQQLLEIVPDPGQIKVSIQRHDHGLQIQSQVIAGGRAIQLKGKGPQRSLQIISNYPMWVLSERTLFRLENEGAGNLVQTLLSMPDIEIPAAEEEDFLDNFYLQLAQSVTLEGDEVAWEEVQAEPVSRLYLNESRGKLQAELRFGYADYEVPYAPGQDESVVRKPDSWTLVRVVRQPAVEEERAKSLSSASFRLKRSPKPAPPSTFMLRASAHPIDFLLHSIPRLVEAGFEIYGEEKLRLAQVNRNKPTLSLNVSSGIDWFDVQAVVNFGELQVSMKEIRKAVRKKERYVKLADGSIGEIPDEWIERYKHLFALGEDTQEGLRLSNHHLTLIDQLLDGADGTRLDEEFERRRALLRNFSGIQPVPLPKHFAGELRPYQKAGYDWLHFLRQFHFGGCLADDMGLGKTIQALVFFQSLKEGCAGTPPGHASLIVVPRSLLINWQREASRFTPDLRILEYFDQSRPGDPAVFDSYDLVITTYGVLLRDIEGLRHYPFHYVVLDESQAIKNPVAQTSKAVRLLKSDHRLVLTGTPVENSTMELWSQFAFLNPGLLGSLEYFKTEFTSPIEKKGSEETAQFLRKMVYPFILRRTKDQVTPELPPRTERIIYSDMETGQRKLYNRTRDLYRGMLLGMLEEQGLNSMRMKILEGLLRLRQISNHPLLMDDKFRGDSGKFELLIETLETLNAEGHKALVFSQFVQMLRLVRKELDGRGIPYTYLDGHTRNRQEQVDRYQSDPTIPFFLISLKAGGTGLNLTAADYVIHIDPWWNPAVEMQATDRTHRIGQDKPVFVYKLITRDSVEEKILQLQERKKNLVDQLITTEAGFFKALTAEDVSTLFS